MNIREKFDHFFQTQLNPEQQQVVAPHEGVMLVCAGAGSGKTRVITSRMVSLMVNHQVRPHAIIALTFTNKAAKEMKERISRFLGNEGSSPYVGTFHSYCLRMLKSNAHLLKTPTFSLIDESDQEKIVRTIIQQKGLSKKVTAKQVLSAISRGKNEAINQTEREALWGQDLLLKELCLLYEQHKTAAHCFDFDDLLLETLTLFQKNATFKSIFQEHVKHILVDEYQDTNKVQHALLKEMAQDSSQGFSLDSLCVVGDEDQSIYSWRGATVSNIMNFSKDFPQAVSITIPRNYRSVQPILHTANEVIKNNSFRNPKQLYSDREAHDRVRLMICASSYQEGEALAHLMRIGQASSSLNNYAVLYRSHFQSRSLEEALIRYSIPYKIMGGIQFYDRLEIKDILAYLRLIMNPFDRLAFSRIFNTPGRGLGDKFEDLFYATWDFMPFSSFSEIGQHLISTNQLTKVKTDSLTHFLAVFTGLTPELKPSTLVQTILERTRYYTYLKDAFEKDESEAKRDNIKELVNGILFFEDRNDPTLETFLSEVSLLQEQMHAAEDTLECVKLMTFHAAKGLEFETVVLTGVEEGILPSSRSLYNPESLEEERRLMYVGITRARERLLLMRAKYRYTYGQVTDQPASRFLSEIPEEYAMQTDCSFWKEYDFKDYFTEWLSKKGAPTPKRAAPKSLPDSLNDEFQPAFSDEEDEFKESPLWRRGQQVVHKSFGQGTIEKIEEKSSHIYLTIRFKSGIKKLDSPFVTPA
ncbi:UvrD-helicase domain-containing protein [Candidatus Dependentiae bacterium]|nr:UvrD-helicase domain-containing protein [Candidatus Dependentiae bacterium]